VSQKVNIAVVGAGYWGPNMIRNVEQLPDAVLHTICDLDEKTLQKAARNFRPLHISQDVEQVMNNPDIEGVIIATPAHTHAALARQALQAGKHVLVEKPLALNSADCQMLIDLAAQQGKILMVGHVFEYNPAVTKLKDLVQGGELGNVLYIYSTRVNLGIIRDDLNAFWNLAPHDISILNLLLGASPLRVSAQGFQYVQRPQRLEDVVFAVLEYPNGVVAHIHTSWLDPNKVRRMTVVGDKKMVVYDDVSENRLMIFDKGVAWVEDGANYGSHRLMTFSGDIYIPKLNATEPLRAEIQHFLDCIRTGTKPLSDGADGREVVRVLEGVAESLAQGGVKINL